MKFCDTGCGQRAAVWRGCYNEGCTSTHYFHLCKEHLALYTHCGVCGGGLDSGVLPDAEPLDKQESKKKRKQKDEEKEPKLLSLDELTATCDTGKVVHSDEMAVTVKVCNGFEMTDAILGHSFHAMRAAEQAIRKQCGVSVSGGTAKGMNVALMELRLLLVDKECNLYQIAVQLCDPYSRNLLLCSTGGVVLTEETEITRLQALQASTAATPEELLVLAELMTRKANGHRLVRCCASPQAYGGSQLFAMCGAYSFFNSGGQIGENLKIAATTYQQTHDGTYRKFVNGPNHDQLFHHSEQTGFKALFQNPDLLVRVLRFAFEQGFLKDLRVSLEAVSIDVFTTRSACRGCMECSVCLLSSGHFFDKALAAVEQAFSSDVVVIENVRTLVRFDCAAMFNDGLLSPKLPKGCVIVHGIPRKEQGAVPDTQGAFATYRIPLTCNATDNLLLDSGSQKQFLPEILRKIQEEMKIIALPQSASGMAELFQKFMARYKGDFYSGVVAAAYLINKLCAGSGSNAIIGQLRSNAERMKMGVDEDLLKLAAKYYNFLRFFENVPNLSTSVGVCGIVGSASYYFGSAEFGRTFLKAFILAYDMAFEQKMPDNFLAQVFDETKRLIRVVIEQLLKMDDATAENAARLLALHYDVLDDYKKLLG